MLIITLFVLYVTGAIITAKVVGMLPDLDIALHDNINTRNPIVTTSVFWPISLVILLVGLIYQFIVRSINSAAGKGFIDEKCEVRRGGLR